MASKGQGNGAVDANAEAQVVAPNAFQRLIIKMSAIATLDDTEGRFAGDDIIPILEAETEEEMWDADERPTYNAKMLSGCALEIYGFDVKFGGANNDDIKTPFVDANGKQMYLLVSAARLNNSGEKKEIRLPEPGEIFTWNTSARNIVGKLFWMLEHGWFDNGRSPVRLRIEGTQLGDGKRSVEKLKKLEGDTVLVSQSADAPF